jgi:MRG-binding protein
MPPRKKAKVTARNTPLRETQAKTRSTRSTRSSSIQAEKEPTPEKEASVAEVDLKNDPWTDEEETLLFKSLIKWKPTGKHALILIKTCITSLFDC